MAVGCLGCCIAGVQDMELKVDLILPFDCLDLMALVTFE